MDGIHGPCELSILQGGCSNICVFMYVDVYHVLEAYF
jgi:hypothetical protein